MTCKDCIHDVVCEYRARQFKENGLETNHGTFSNAEKICAGFKDKSRYIELPCKVGDTAYTVVFKSKFIRSAKVVGFHLGKFPTLRGHARKEYLVCYSNNSCVLSHIDIEQIGKTVFFSREEAEKALAARTD